MTHLQELPRSFAGKPGRVEFPVIVTYFNASIFLQYKASVKKTSPAGMTFCAYRVAGFCFS